MNNLLSDLFRKKTIERIRRDAESGYGDAEHASGALRKELTSVDLTALGIAAVVGAGIFSTIGNAAYNGGPAVAFLFIFTAIACGFSALCYAEFASRIPVAGSAYTYAYASFGELIAWIIGWDLIMEYAIGNIAVAISWSEYFTNLVASYGWKIPAYFTTDFLTASRGATVIQDLLAQGKTLETLQAAGEFTGALKAYAAWTTAPMLGGFHLICNLPAFCITLLVTSLVFIGIRESKRVSNFMVALKIAVILMVIGVGAYFIKPTNWDPFAPNGLSGVLKGVSGVFFAYIGFDAISTTAEECKNPQRDLPIGMIASLVICTILYVLVALVLTGMVSYKTLAVGDPLAFVFGPEGVNVPFVSHVVAISAIVAMTTVLLVFQLGQPRIWMSMSRDGLLPPIFSAIHPRFRTPWFSTILTGIVVAVPSLFTNLTEMTDLTSIGTLFAFVLVSGGVLLLEREDPQGDPSHRGRFRIPYWSGRYLVPAIVLGAVALVVTFYPQALRDFFDPSAPLAPRIPMLVYLVLATAITWLSITRQLSFIPVMGLLTCGYLMTELGITNWIRFGLWLLVGLCAYFLYGRKHSRLRAG